MSASDASHYGLPRYPLYVVGFERQAAKVDSENVAIAVRYLRDADTAASAEPISGGLPRLTTIEVRPEELGPAGLRLDAASRLKLVQAGADPDQVERELHAMQRGDKKLLADVVFGARSGASQAQVDEQVRWFGIAPTEEEEERIARGETVTFLVGG